MRATFAVARRVCLGTLASVLLVGSTSASAAIITVDPDSFAAGTDISAAFAGVTLSAVGGGFGAGPSIFAVDPTAGAEPFTTSTGNLSFGTDSASFPHLFREPAFLHMRVDFAAPTDFVSIDFIANDTPDQGTLSAFDSADNLLGTYTTAFLVANAFESMTFSSGSSNIAYILASGADSGSSGGLDNLQFAVAPEPSTLLLLATAGGAWIRRRRSAR